MVEPCLIVVFLKYLNVMTQLGIKRKVQLLSPCHSLLMHLRKCSLLQNTFCLSFFKAVGTGGCQRCMCTPFLRERSMIPSDFTSFQDLHIVHPLILAAYHDPVFQRVQPACLIFTVLEVFKDQTEIFSLQLRQKVNSVRQHLLV